MRPSLMQLSHCIVIRCRWFPHWNLLCNEHITMVHNRYMYSNRPLHFHSNIPSFWQSQNYHFPAGKGTANLSRLSLSHSLEKKLCVSNIAELLLKIAATAMSFHSQNTHSIICIKVMQPVASSISHSAARLFILEGRFSSSSLLTDDPNWPRKNIYQQFWSWSGLVKCFSPTSTTSTIIFRSGIYISVRFFSNLLFW